MTQRLNRRRALFVEAAVLVLMTGVLVVGHSVAFGAVNCDSVFQGATPQDPIKKTASVATAHPGDTVTFTFAWNSTGTATAELADCFRVDDGSDSALNALVTPLNWTKTHDNVGADGSPQTETQTITIPDDPALIGHTVADRAKATFGSVESRSDIIEVAITAAPSSSPTPTLVPPVSVGPTATTSVKGVSLSATGTDVAAYILLAMLLVGAGVLLRRANRYNA